VPASGGTPEQLTRRDEKRGEHTHHGPQFLPGGRDLLFTVKTGSGESHAAILSFDTRAWAWIEGLGALSGAARYIQTGHLVYPETGATGQLRAVPFDLASRRIVGTPVTLPDEVYTQASSDVVVAQFAASDSGVLSYITGRPPPWSLVRVGVDRKVKRLGSESRTFRYPRVSPDGSQIAVTIAEERSDIYLLNVERGILRSITATGSNTQPVWMNARDLVFSSTRQGAQGWDLYSIPADVGGDVAPELLLSRPGGQFPSGWSPAAPVLVFYELGNDTARDVWTWSRDTREPARLLGTAASERAAVFSPDGAWLAYVSDELAGRDEVYIQRYPGPGGRERISTDGGTEPLWSPRGSELYYRKGRTLYSVSIDRVRGVPQGAPRVVLEDAYELAPADVGRANYDVFPDGSFVFIRSETRNLDWHVHVVLNWFDELRQSSQR
jgi:Tol biopolymer transport system component